LGGFGGVLIGKSGPGGDFTYKNGNFTYENWKISYKKGERFGAILHMKMANFAYKNCGKWGFGAILHMEMAENVILHVKMAENGVLGGF
jgi:hypothetical protein